MAKEKKKNAATCGVEVETDPTFGKRKLNLVCEGDRGGWASERMNDWQGVPLESRWIIIKNKHTHSANTVA